MAPYTVWNMHKVAPLSIWSDAMCGYAWNYGIRNARIFLPSVHLTVLWWHAFCIIKTLKGIGKEPSNIYKDKQNRISKCCLTIFFPLSLYEQKEKHWRKSQQNPRRHRDRILDRGKKWSVPKIDCTHSSIHNGLHVSILTIIYCLWMVYFLLATWETNAATVVWKTSEIKNNDANKFQKWIRIAWKLAAMWAHKSESEIGSEWVREREREREWMAAIRSEEKK